VTTVVSERLAARLRSARSVAVFTGAGISAESGVPTFRGEEGLWKRFKPEELANVDAFMRNPELVWQWYRYRRDLIASIEPNAGHRAIAAMERFHERFAVITQNIDNLHQRAGSSVVHELHGNIRRSYCVQCGSSVRDEVLETLWPVPACPKCGGNVRPDVVWFGELLPAEPWNESVKAASRAEVFFSVGTSGVVFPAASLPLTAKRAGAYLVEINLEPTDLSMKADEVLLGKSGEILPALVTECYSTTAGNA
jgi:NAD-dependent deacetylase